MRDIDLFQQALGLTPPWRVERSEFDPESKQLDLYLDFPRGSTFVCPECGRSDCKAYDSQEKIWRHLDFFEHPAYLHARLPRIQCPLCGIKTVSVPWARSGSGFTLLFEAFVMVLVREMPVRAVARLVGEHDTRIWRILHHYVDYARSQADYSEVTHVGIDETSRAKRHKYISVFVDLDQPRVMFAEKLLDVEFVESHLGCSATTIFRRPVDSREDVTKPSIQKSVSTHRGCLWNLMPFQTRVNQLPGHERTPLFDPAL